MEEPITVQPVSIWEELRGNYRHIQANFKCPQCSSLFGIPLNFPIYIEQEQDIDQDFPFNCPSCDAAGSFHVAATCPANTNIVESRPASTALIVNANDLNSSGYMEIVTPGYKANRRDRRKRRT